MPEMPEMSAGTEQINSAVQKVSEMSDDNRNCIKRLSVEVSKFKV